MPSGRPTVSDSQRSGIKESPGSQVFQQRRQLVRLKTGKLVGHGIPKGSRSGGVSDRERRFRGARRNARRLGFKRALSRRSRN
jgi:hypothetical protein